MNIFTKTLNIAEIISIQKSDGVMQLSVQASPAGGSFSISGGIPFQNMQPSEITLTDGQSITLNSYNPTIPITGVTITCLSGNVDFMVGF